MKKGHGRLNGFCKQARICILIPPCCTTVSDSHPECQQSLRAAPARSTHFKGWFWMSAMFICLQVDLLGSHKEPRHQNHHQYKCGGWLLKGAFLQWHTLEKLEINSWWLPSPTWGLFGKRSIFNLHHFPICVIWWRTLLKIHKHSLKNGNTIITLAWFSCAELGSQKDCSGYERK